MEETVFLLRHVHYLPGQEDDVEYITIIGIYSSALKAAQAEEKARLLPGFGDLPDGFHTSKYQLDKTHWLEGFVTV